MNPDPLRHLDIRASARSTEFLLRLKGLHFKCKGMQVVRKRLVASALLASLILPFRIHAAEEVENLPPKLDSTIAKGLDFLAKSQNPDGSVHGGGPPVAITALTLMAFLASGHTPDSGKYGLVVRNATDFLIKNAREDGYFGAIDGSRMYGQGIVTLALAEVAGAETDPVRRKKIRTEVEKSVKLIMKAQEVPKPEGHQGGWRYEPTASDSDLSLSGWNALALRASQNIGMPVPKEAVARAVKFVISCNLKDAGFGYQPGGGGMNPGMTGVGILNLCLLDDPENPLIPKAAKYMTDNPIAAGSQYKYYYLYYTTQAAFQVGSDTWAATWKVTTRELIDIQQPDGGWPASNEPGRVYATSMSVLTLSVPYRLLPIYQR